MKECDCSPRVSVAEFPLVEDQLTEMEKSVQFLEQKICSITKERQNLDEFKKLVTGSCAPTTCPGLEDTCTQKLLRELREKYDRLQDDFKSKMIEVANLRMENEKFKLGNKENGDYKKIADDKMKECQKLMRNLKLENSKFIGLKEQLKEKEQQIIVAKQRFRDTQDEVDELKATIQDQQRQLEDYRNKYLEAQQQVEEHRRQIDVMEVDSNRLNEQINSEIHRVKCQFQEKLQELSPLPDILKQTQLKLQEAQQMNLVAERNNESLSRELQNYRCKVASLMKEIEANKNDRQNGADGKNTLSRKIEELEKRLSELLDDNIRLQTELSDAEEQMEKFRGQSETQLHEIAQLMGQVENVREESARQVARTKERCEAIRRTMQNQISDLERQVAFSRAVARAAEKDRDEIRMKMEAQINNLNENFDQAQNRIRSLQENVNYLKHSYPAVSPDDDAVCNC